MTRRTFLGASATALSLAAQPARRERILIIGGGLAGLCAAFELQDRYDVTVLEAQRHPGGRVRTLREAFPPGLYCEAGAEGIPSTHDLTLHYAKQFGLPLAPMSPPGMRSFYYLKGQRIFSADPEKAWPFDLTPDERSIGVAGLRKKYLDEPVQRALAAGFKNDPLRAMAEWDQYTPGEWFRKQGASRAASELLSLGFGADFGSAASFLLHRVSFVGATGTQRIEGGNDLLPREFAKRLRIEYGSPVVSVVQNEATVSVTKRSHRGTETVTADRVICALPCPAIGAIFADARLSGAKRDAIRRQNYSHCAKVFLQSRTRFWLANGLSGGVTTDLPIERLAPDPGTAAGDRGALAAYPIGVYTSELEQKSEDDRVHAAFTQARRIFPECAEQFEGGVSKCWGLDPWQKGAFALHTPGQIGYIEVLAKPEGRIHFAGEHTSVWTGWMQGALESARRVVREIGA